MVLKLNVDCVRDLMLVIEREAGLGEYLTYSNLCNSLDYPGDVIAYTALKLEEAGFIRCSTKNVRTFPEALIIQELTYYGHQFLEDIRSDSNWDKVKSVSASVGSASLRALSEIAANVIANLIKAQL